MTTKQERKRLNLRRRIRAMGFQLGRHLEYVVTMRLATSGRGYKDYELRLLADMAKRGLFQ